MGWWASPAPPWPLLLGQKGQQAAVKALGTTSKDTTAGVPSFVGFSVGRGRALPWELPVWRQRRGTQLRPQSDPQPCQAGQGLLTGHIRRPLLASLVGAWHTVGGAPVLSRATSFPSICSRVVISQSLQAQRLERAATALTLWARAPPPRTLPGHPGFKGESHPTAVQGVWGGAQADENEGDVGQPHPHRTWVGTAWQEIRVLS